MLWQCGWPGTNTPPDEGGQKKLPPPGVLALCQLCTHAVKEVSEQHFETVRTHPSRSTSAVVTPPSSSPNGSPSSPAQARHSDLRTNYKQFGVKAITSQIKNQPANLARSTNVHRATHAENYAHCVNCDTNCFKTSKNSFKWSPLNYCWHSTQLHHVVTILDVFRFQQLILKFVRLVSKLVRLASKLSVTLFHWDT